MASSECKTLLGETKEMKVGQGGANCKHRKCIVEMDGNYGERPARNGRESGLDSGICNVGKLWVMTVFLPGLQEEWSCCYHVQHVIWSRFWSGSDGAGEVCLWQEGEGEANPLCWKAGSWWQQRTRRSQRWSERGNVTHLERCSWSLGSMDNHWLDQYLREEHRSGTRGMNRSITERYEVDKQVF